eukprot:COSAG05_NODE_1518_length_4652_cov_4.416209_3_plen_426_part_00
MKLLLLFVSLVTAAAAQQGSGSWDADIVAEEAPEPEPEPKAEPPPPPPPAPPPPPPNGKKVVATLAISGAVSQDSFAAELQKKLPQDAVVSVTAYEMAVKSSATLTCPTGGSFSQKQLDQFVAGVKAASGAESITLGTVGGCARRRLGTVASSRRQLAKTAAAIGYEVKTSDPAAASKMATAMTDTTAFAKALVAQINKAGNDLVTLSESDATSEKPEVTTEIKYEIVVPKGTDVSPITLLVQGYTVTDGKSALATIADSAKVPGTPKIEAKDVTGTSTVTSPPPPPPPPRCGRGCVSNSEFCIGSAAAGQMFSVRCKSGYTGGGTATCNSNSRWSLPSCRKAPEPVAAAADDADNDHNDDDDGMSPGLIVVLVFGGIVVVMCVVNALDSGSGSSSGGRSRSTGGSGACGGGGAGCGGGCGGGGG